MSDSYIKRLSISAKLNGSNYNAWAEELRSILQHGEVWGIIEGWDPEPAQPMPVTTTTTDATGHTTTATTPGIPSEEWKKWKLRDVKGQGIINLSIEESEKEHLSSMTYTSSIKDMWEALKTAHTASSPGLEAFWIRGKLWAHKYTNGDPIETHIAGFVNFNRELAALGSAYTLDDEQLAHHLLHCLPDDWRLLTTTFLVANPKVTFRNACDCVRDEIRHRTNTPGDETAYGSQFKAAGKLGGGNSGSRSKGKGKKDE